ncbi:hypothetical protein [Lactococcus garvieae]
MDEKEYKEKLKGQLKQLQAPKKSEDSDYINWTNVKYLDTK